MKKFFVYIAIILLFGFSKSFADGLTIYFNYAVFADENGSPYIETYLSIPQHQLKHIEAENGMFYSELSVSLIFKRNDTIMDFAKYSLNSGYTSDTVNINKNIIDQQRLFLDNGNYILELNISDKNNKVSSIHGATEVVVEIPKDDLSISTITFVDKLTKVKEKSILTKVGYDMLPYFTIFYPDSRNVLNFYAEIYNLEKTIPNGSDIIVYYLIENYEIPGSYINDASKFSKLKSSHVVPLLQNIDLSEVPSGNYNLVVKVKDSKGNDVLIEKKFFQRENLDPKFDNSSYYAVNEQQTFVSKFTDIDSLRYMIKSFTPKSTELERHFIYKIDSIKDINILQNFVYKFWNDRYSINAENKLNEYLKQVEKVEEVYSNNIRHGFETDRGRVYLKYGAPNHVHRNQISSATIPFEIWQYYQLPDGQRNKRFVFATPDLALKDFDLIHSDVVGELNNPKWQYDLHLNAPIIDDNLIYEEMWGSRIQEYYEDPR
ncbi:MAG: GWxTD domain-containing protein [Bacteroidales bacterium]